MVQPRSLRRQVRWSRRGARAAVWLAGLSLIVILDLGKPVLAPLAMALWFSVLLAPFVEGLYRLRVPRSIGAALLLLALATGATSLVEAVRQPATAWLASAPVALRKIEHKIRPIRHLVASVDQVGRHAEHMADGTSDSQASAPAPSMTTGLSVVALASALPAVAVSILTSVVVAFFLLIGGPPLLDEMVSVVAGASVSRVRVVVEATRSELGRYYATIALINLGLGAATSIAMQLLGMPNPLLWGTVAAVLNFVPYFGSACTFLVLCGVALVTFDSLDHVLAVAGSFLFLMTLEGQIVQPLLVGRRLQLRPLAVLLGVWFFSALWGVVGLILAVPVLLTMKVAA